MDVLLSFSKAALCLLRVAAAAAAVGEQFGLPPAPAMGALIASRAAPTANARTADILRACAVFTMWSLRDGAARDGPRYR